MHDTDACYTTQLLLSFFFQAKKKIDLPSDSQDVVVQPTLVKGHVIGGWYRTQCSSMVNMAVLFVDNLVRNSMQFNGEYGCTFCGQPGETFHTGRGTRRHILVFPFDEKNPDGSHCTAATIKQYSVVTVEENQVVSHHICIIL